MGDNSDFIETTDVYTKPPTALRLPMRFFEDTVGLQLLRDGTLTTPPSICFQHGYAKCKGRDGLSASTCRQLHVVRKTLWEMRAAYDTQGKTVRPLCRTIKALLPESLRRSQPNCANLRYMEFNYEHIAATRGRENYLQRYSNYLLSESDDTRSFELVEQLCEAHGTGGRCVNAEACEHIHAPIQCAISRRERLQRWRNDSRGSGGCSSSDGGGGSGELESVLARFAMCFNTNSSNSNNGQCPPGIS